MSAETRTTNRSTVKTLSPRQPLGQDHRKQWFCTNDSSAQSDFAAAWNWTTGFVWSEENWPPNWAWFLPRFFSPFCHRWSFGSLPLSPLACLVGDTSFTVISLTWLQIIAQILFKLNWAAWWHHWIQWWTAFVILHYWHTVFLINVVQLLWHNLFCLKRYINKGDLTWLKISFTNDSFNWFRVDSYFWETITLYTVHFQI